jgi:hypothetical protein
MPILLIASCSKNFGFNYLLAADWKNRQAALCNCGGLVDDGHIPLAVQNH